MGQTITQVITSCSDNACSEHTISAIASVAVTTVGTTVSSYITYCPFADSAFNFTQTSVVATEIISSCSDGECTKLNTQDTLNPTATTTSSNIDNSEPTSVQTYSSVEQLTISSISSSTKASSVSLTVATYQGEGSQLKTGTVTILMVIFAMLF